MRQDGRSVDQRTLDDFQARRTKVRARADIGARDTFDAVATVLVGLLEGAEAMEALVRSYDLPVALRDEALSVCRQLSASASRHALDLIEIRLRLLRRGVTLPEAA